MNALYRGGQTGMAMDEKGYSQWQGSGMSEVSWLWSHGQQVLLRNSVMVSAGAAGGLVPLFRSVGVDEAAQIDKTGQFEAGPGLEGKYFFQTQEQAENIAAKFSKFEAQTLTTGQISSEDLALYAEEVNAAGEGPAV